MFRSVSHAKSTRVSPTVESCLTGKALKIFWGMATCSLIIPRRGACPRHEGRFVEEHEIEATVEYLKDISGPQYERELTVVRDDSLNSQDDPVKVLEKALEDPKFDEAVKMLIEPYDVLDHGNPNKLWDG